MTTYHSNVHLEIADINGLTWKNHDPNDLTGTENLVESDKTHDINTIEPIITCVPSDPTGDGDSNGIVKLSFNINIPDPFTVNHFDDANVQNVGSDGSLGGSETVATDSVGDSVDVKSISAMHQMMCRAYTAPTATSLLNFHNVKTAFVETNPDNSTDFVSIEDFSNIVVSKTTIALNTLLRTTPDVDMWVKFETDVVSPHYRFYDDPSCEAANEITSSYGTDMSKLLVRMLQICNENHNLKLAEKLSSTIVDENNTSFNVFNGQSLIIPVKPSVNDAFNNSPGNFGVVVKFM
jgi:hypothetical protein